MLSFKTKQLDEKAPPGMKQLVKGFKADGMDDDKAFALAWSIYNKKKKSEEKTPARPQEDDSGWVEEYITEAYTIAYETPADIKHIGYSNEQLGQIADLYKDVKGQHDTPLVFDTNPKNKQIKLQTSIFDKALAATI